jgi:hypothetical protein
VKNTASTADTVNSEQTTPEVNTVRNAIAVLAALLVSFLIPTLTPLHAQATTYEGSAVAGWSGPCESWWQTSAFSFDAMRVCRVTTSLVYSIEKNKDATSAKLIADQLFRICWGDFPRSGGSCSVSNAWAIPRGWVGTTGVRTPVVITLRASEDLQSDDEVAFILSHEMGHAIDPQQTVDQNTRQNELRADLFGIGFVLKAGYDVRSAGRGLQMITGERGQGLVGNLFGMLSHAGDGSDAHGLTQDRIGLMKQEFAKGCAQLNNRPVGCKGGWK